VLPFLVLSFGFKLLTSVNLFRTDNISHAPPPNSVSITAIPSESRRFRQNHGDSVSFTAILPAKRQFRQLHGNSGRITAVPAESRQFRQNHGNSGRITAIPSESRRFRQNNDYSDSKTAKTRKKGLFLPFCHSCEWKTRNSTSCVKTFRRSVLPACF